MENPLVGVFLERDATTNLRAPGVRDQTTPVNRYTTRGFSWVMDFRLILVGLGGRI